MIINKFKMFANILIRNERLHKSLTSLQFLSGFISKFLEIQLFNPLLLH